MSWFKGGRTVIKIEKTIVTPVRLQKFQVLYSLFVYLIICPVLIYGTALGKINQSPVEVTVELFIICCLSLLITLQTSNDRLKHLAFGFILLGLAVGSRSLSFWIPGVNAMAAVVMLVGIYGGSHLGFVVGCLAPYLTNMIFLQGAWTPFQMFAYGMLGVIAGLPFISKKSQSSRIFLTSFGIMMGIAYSFFMDSWTMISFGNDYGWQLYILLIVQAIPYTVTYMISNGVFINILKKPITVIIDVIGRR